MSIDWFVGVLSRWGHVLAAVVAVGGLLFFRLVLMPSASETLPDAEHQSLREAIRRRWQKVVLVCIGLLLVTGFYNFFTISLAKAKDAPAYHMLFGLKFLAALGVFFLASVLTGRAKGFAAMRAASARWLAVAAVLAVAVILISGVLKNLP
jgi:uncharacterized membrane protein